MERSNYSREVRDLIDRILMLKETNGKGRLGACKKLLSIAKEKEDDVLMGAANYYLAEYYYSTATSFEKMSVYASRALQYAHRTGDDEFLSRAYNMLGVDAFNRGHVELCVQYYMLSRSYAGRIENFELLALTNFNLAAAYADMGDDEGALKNYMLSYRYCKKCGLVNVRALYCRIYICNAVSVLYLKRNEPAKAIKLQKEFEHLRDIYAKKTGIVFRESISMIAQICYLQALGETEKRQEMIDDYIENLSGKPAPVDAISDIISFCEILVKNGEYDNALRLSVVMRRRVEDVAVPYIRMRFARLMADFFAIRGDETNRRHYIERYYEYAGVQQAESRRAFESFLEMMNLVDKVRQENVILRKKASTDELTGIPNRADMNVQLEHFFAEAFERQESLGVEIFDVDKFKHYNDAYGHQTGDRCLMAIGDILGELADERIYVARYGGDEFFICYRNMTDKEISDKASWLKHRLSTVTVPTGEGEITGISISQGIRNSIPIPENHVWDYLYTADSALYSIKKSNPGEILILHQMKFNGENLKP